jgi:hypothetical protein
MKRLETPGNTAQIAPPMFHGRWPEVVKELRLESMPKSTREPDKKLMERAKEIYISVGLEVDNALATGEGLPYLYPVLGKAIGFDVEANESYEEIKGKRELLIFEPVPPSTIFSEAALLDVVMRGDYDYARDVYKKLKDLNSESSTLDPENFANLFFIGLMLGDKGYVKEIYDMIKTPIPRSQSVLVLRYQQPLSPVLSYLMGNTEAIEEWDKRIDDPENWVNGIFRNSYLLTIGVGLYFALKAGVNIFPGAQQVKL